MEEHLRNFVVYPFDRDLCHQWARVTDEGRRKGRPVGVADAWIAATAILYSVPLITNNHDHFTDIDNLILISEST